MSRERKTCRWYPDDAREWGIWTTDCGAVWHVADAPCSTLNEIGMRFCPYCGRKLRIPMAATHQGGS